MRGARALLAMAAAAALVGLAAAAPADTLRLRVEADRGSIRLGDPLRLLVVLDAPLGSEVTLPGPEAALGPFTLLERRLLAPDTLAPDLVRHAAELTVTAFTLDEATLPPLVAQVRGREGTIRTAVSDSLTLGITSVLPDTAGVDSLDIRPLKAQVELPGAGRRRLLFALVALFLALLALLAVLWIRRRRRRAAPALAPVSDLRPPDVIALAELSALGAMGLAHAGRMKEHYTRLTAILRSYLERRFAFPAVDLTTAEILAAFAGRASAGDAARSPAEVHAELERLLSQADLVKFARYKPPAAVAEGEVERAADFVRATALRPAVAQSAPPGTGTAPVEVAGR